MAAIIISFLLTLFGLLLGCAWSTYILRMAEFETLRKLTIRTYNKMLDCPFTSKGDHRFLSLKEEGKHVYQDFGIIHQDKIEKRLHGIWVELVKYHETNGESFSPEKFTEIRKALKYNNIVPNRLAFFIHKSKILDL